MNLTHIKQLSLALASVLTLGVIGCNTTNPPNGEAPDNPITPPKAPSIAAPLVQYNFYEPTSEENLKKDSDYGYLIAKTLPGFKPSIFERHGLKVAGGFSANGAVYYRLEKERDAKGERNVMGALKDLKKIHGVMFVEPDLKAYLDAAVETSPIEFDADTTDNYLANRLQWGAFATKAYDAWAAYGFGEHRSVMASIDTGVRYNHEDLKDVIKHAFSIWGADGNTQPVMTPDLAMGEMLDFLVEAPDGAGTDNNGHGTHTIGTMAAVGNNGKGVAGMCWNSDVISYKFANNDGNSSLWTIFGALWHLAKWKEAEEYQSVIPVNMSLGMPTASYFAVDMIENALSHNVMVVASSGNNYQRLHQYPAAYSGVMSVGASNIADRRAFFSNWGHHLSVIAPGEDIYSTYRTTTATDNSSYYKESGTSMATPHVTGLVGYMLTFNPGLKPDQIKTYIETCADYVDGATGFTEQMGWGRINVFETIKAVIGDLENDRTPPSNYVNSPVKIKLPLNGVGVYLYNCNQEGTIINYAACSISGPSLMGLLEKDDLDMNADAENGVVHFSMLKPGLYVAKAYLGPNLMGSTDVFEIKAGEAPPEQSLRVDQALTIQTMGTQDFKTSGKWVDSEIWVYDSLDGDYIWSREYYLMDTLTFPMPTAPGTYYIRITDFDNGAGAGLNDGTGEYAIYVTNGNLYPEESSAVSIGTGNFYYPLAPGTVASPGADGDTSSRATTRSAAQLIEFDKVYYGLFESVAESRTNGHYYKFVVPEPQ